MYKAKFKCDVRTLIEDETPMEEAGVVVGAEVTFKSENRNYMRSLELLCEENGYPCVTTVEVTPRIVTFKGLPPTQAVEAKKDAKADIKAAGDKK